MNKFIKTNKELVGKFSFSEMTSNESGKTSGSGTMGVIIICVGALSFLFGIIDKMFLNNDADILTQTILFTSIGASLLGVRKLKGTKYCEDKKYEERVKKEIDNTTDLNVPIHDKNTEINEDESAFL